MKKLLTLGVLGLGAVAVLGAVCQSPTETNTISGLSVEVNEGDLIKYDTTTYVYSLGTKRGITTAEVFEGCGYKWEEVRLLEKADFDQIPEGPVLNDTTNCPQK